MKLPIGKEMKPCPECGNILVVRENHETKGQFLGCRRWPDCLYHEGIPEDVKMRARGAVTLPGFE